MIFRFKGNGNERIVDNCPQWRTPCGILCSYPQSPAGTSGLVPAGDCFQSPFENLAATGSGEAIGTRGGFSPRPDIIAGARCSSPFGPFQRAAPLRAYALATFRSNPPHRSASLHFAHCLRRITGRLLPAILLRQRTPFGNSCKLSLTHGNIAIANYHG